MASKLETPNTHNLDWLKWIIVTLLIIAGIVANYHYNGQPWPLRLVAWIFLLGISLGIILQTQKGKLALSFVRESRIELRKVVWPTRPEVIKTTLVIGGLVIALALILWGVDGILVRLIGWLTGQRG